VDAKEARMTTRDGTAKALRRRTVLAMAASAGLLAGAARAQGPGDLVDLQVVDRETGQVLRVCPHDRRARVAGQPGARYSLRVTNRSDGRVLVVMSVDGVNILTGETAAYGQRGYVFGPYETYDIAGWRKSETEVAAFTFAPLPQSYAARTGRPGDVGVIGIAAFRERAVAPVPPVAMAAPARDSEVNELVVTAERRGASAAPPLATGRAAQAPRAPSPPPLAKPAPHEVAALQPRTEKLGTGHGAREWSVSYTVPFERATAYPQQVRRIEYDTFDNLVASGVIRRPWTPERGPRPFPGAAYVPDPPGRF